MFLYCSLVTMEEYFSQNIGMQILQTGWALCPKLDASQLPGEFYELIAFSFGSIGIGKKLWIHWHWQDYDD